MVFLCLFLASKLAHFARSRSSWSIPLPVISLSTVFAHLAFLYLSNSPVTRARMATELWRHENAQSTHMWRFLEHVNAKYRLELSDYPTLYRWSVDNVASFWEEVWDFAGVRSSRRFDVVSTPTHPATPFLPPSNIRVARRVP